MDKKEKFKKVEGQIGLIRSITSSYLFYISHNNITLPTPSLPTMEVTAAADTNTNSPPPSHSSTNDDFELFPIYAAEAMNPSRRSTMEDCYSILRPGTWNETIPDLSKSILEGIASQKYILGVLFGRLILRSLWLTPLFLF